MIHQFCKLDRYVEWHVGFTHGELRYGPHKDVWVTTVDFGFGKVGARDWCAAMEKSSSTFFLGGVVRAEKSNSSKIKPNTLKGTFGDLRCDNVRVHSATQWTASVHSLHMSKPVITFVFTDCFGTYFTHVQTCDNVRVHSATQWTASIHTLHMSKPVITFVFTVLRSWLLRSLHMLTWYETGKLCKWREKRERISLLSRKWSFRYGKTFISFQILAFFNISASTYFSASAENTVKVTKSRIKGQTKKTEKARGRSGTRDLVFWKIMMFLKLHNS